MSCKFIQALSGGRKRRFEILKTKIKLFIENNGIDLKMKLYRTSILQNMDACEKTDL